MVILTALNMVPRQSVEINLSSADAQIRCYRGLRDPITVKLLLAIHDTQSTCGGKQGIHTHLQAPQPGIREGQLAFPRQSSLSKCLTASAASPFVFLQQVWLSTPI